jgi:cell division protein FtsW
VLARSLDHDRGLFLSLACALMGVGVLMVHSASITSWPTDFEQVYLSRHLLRLGLGVGLAGICAALPARFWFRSAPWLLAGSIGLLVLVLVPGIGSRVNGAQRWLRYGPLSLQPSDVAKITLALVVCRALSRRDRLEHWLKGTIPILVPAAITIPLVLVEPDLGTAVFLAAGCGIALFAGGWPLRYFFVSGALGVGACVTLVAMKPYQLRRITGFLDAWSDFSQAPYQLQQSLISLGAGGPLGVGLGQGWQKLSFLPEANTDFVFAVVGEELGLAGTLGLVAVWCGFYVAGLRLLRHLDRDSFAWLAGFTLLTQLALQATLNMAVVTALVPPKGIPHPLISYGGSNLVMSIASLGIIASLARDDGTSHLTPAQDQPDEVDVEEFDDSEDD